MRTSVMCLPLFCTALAAASSFAEEKEQSAFAAASSAHYRNAFGVAAGVSTGYGLSYRRWFNDRLGLQLNVGPYYYEDEDEQTIRTSVGIAPLLTIHEFTYARFLSYAGFHWYHEDQWWENEYCRGTEACTNESYHDTFFLGIGAGTEFHLWRFSLNIMVGLAGYYLRDDLGESTKSVMVSPEAGLHYRF